MRLIPALGAALFASTAAAQPAGERVYRQCYACHALEPGRNTPAGPTLHNIIGRPIAGERGFNYSPAMRRFAVRHGRWTPTLLDRFIVDPEGLVPGTEMSLVGISNAAERRVLIDWLRRWPRRN